MRRCAILVGVNDYTAESGLSPLRYAEADVHDLAQSLQLRCGFEAHILTGAPATADEVKRLLFGLHGGDLLLFFFAGHGILIDGSYHLMTAGSDVTGFGSLGFNLLARYFQAGRCPFPAVLAILDACRTVGRGAAASQLTQDTVREIRTATQGHRHVEILYGCKEGQLCLEDPELEHGLLTHALLQVLGRSHKQLDIARLAEETNEVLRQWTEHDPAGRTQLLQRLYIPRKERIHLIGPGHDQPQVSTPPAPDNSAQQAQPRDQLHHAYRMALAANVSNDAIYYAEHPERLGHVIRGINGSEIVSAGLSCRARTHRGELFALVELEPLILAARRKELRIILNSCDTSDLAIECARPVVESSASEATKYELRKTAIRGDSLACILLAVFFGDYKASRTGLDIAVTEASDAATWCCGLARVFALAHGDEHRARDILEYAESISTICWEWTECAAVWLEVFRDEGRALECLYKAEKAIEGLPYESSHDHWRICARTWMQLFNDNEEARRCMALSLQRCVHDSDDDPEPLQSTRIQEVWPWAESARAWNEVFFDAENSVHCIKMAEELSKDSSNWTLCAYLWIDLHAERTRAQRCAEEAERKAESDSGWLSCAEFWARLEDKTRSRRCMRRAEKASGDSSDSWHLCASTWNRSLASRRDVKRCLERAESFAEDTHAYNVLVQRQLEFPGCCLSD